MNILGDGTFRFTIEGEALARGLRPSKRAARNAKYLIQCVGAIGKDQVLQVIDDLSSNRIDTSAITDSFPYPQLFITPNFITICGQTAIYELEGSSLVSKLSSITSGNLWSMIAIGEFAYLSNNSVAVLRDPATGTYSLTTAQPSANAIADYNGQVIIGSPNE